MREETTPRVKVSHVSKRFCRSLRLSYLYGLQDFSAELLGRRHSDNLRPHEFWALKDVSFELLQGQSIGLVGRNGSGKTTLLRLVCGILLQTSGDISVNGRVAPLIALGAGFKPMLSGRENIFLNLSLLGISEDEIRNRLDSIISFAELGDSVDAPVGTYSSGMQARLGFSCAIHTNPELLIVDELLAVGDVKFRVKCRNKINELRKDGVSMLLVSHSAASIDALTDKAILLDKGEVIAEGETKSVLKRYEELLNSASSTKKTSGVSETLYRSATSGGLVRIKAVRLQSQNDGPESEWTEGGTGEIEVELVSEREVVDVSVNIIVRDLTNNPGEIVQRWRSAHELGEMVLPEGTNTVRVLLGSVGLRKGTYQIKVSVSQGVLNDLLDAVDHHRLVVRGGLSVGEYTYYQTRSWQLVGPFVSRDALESDQGVLIEAEDLEI